jgi:c-di-GMP-binding flagellar brake protein YcgR
LGAGFLITLLRERSTSRRHARQRARVVRELLHNAIVQRSTLEIEFTSEEIQGRVVSGPCSLIEDDMVIVDVGLEHTLQTWIGGLVEVSFKLDYKDTSAYYHFASQVIGMRHGPQAIAVELALPPHILPTQKRSYMRITPLPSHMLGIGLWPLDPAQPLPQDSTGLGTAALSYRPGRVDQCSLVNLSAGGMRMEVPLALLHQLPANLTLESQLLCLLLLRAPDDDLPMPFWFACTVVSLLKNQEDASNVTIGLKFRAWALSETGSHEIDWFPAGKTGEVAPLATWVLRHQLAQTRG